MMVFTRYRVLVGVAGLLALPLTTAFQEAGEEAGTEDDTSPAAETASPAAPSEYEGLSPNDPAITSLPGAFQYVGIMTSLGGDDYEDEDYHLYRRPVDGVLTEYYKVSTGSKGPEARPGSSIHTISMLGGLMRLREELIYDHHFRENGEAYNDITVFSLTDLILNGASASPSDIEKGFMDLEVGQSISAGGIGLYQSFSTHEVSFDGEFHETKVLLESETCLALPFGRVPVKVFRTGRTRNYFWPEQSLVVQYEIEGRGDVPDYVFWQLTSLSAELASGWSDRC